MTDEKKLFDHLEIQALPRGGYVVREGKWNGAEFGREDERRWSARWEIAAFTTLEQAVKWVLENTISKRST